MLNTHTLPGQSYPLGATVYPDGVNFSIFSKSCEALELLLFDDPAATKPSRVIRFDPKRNKTFYYWHVFVPGIGAGQLYGYRAYGPSASEQGHRFDGGKVLVDPYARAVTTENYDRQAAMRPGESSMSWAAASPMAFSAFCVGSTAARGFRRILLASVMARPGVRIYIGWTPAV